MAPSPFSAATNVAVVDGKAKNIRMMHEEVTIELHPSFAVVDATFTMRNDGPQTKLEVGFPGEGADLGVGFMRHTALYGFVAWVDGKAVESTAKPLDVGGRPEKKARVRGDRAVQGGKRVTLADPEGRQAGRRSTETWHVFSALFPAKKETTLRVRYGVVAEPAYDAENDYNQPPALDSVWYILETGSAWKGPIESGLVRVVAGASVDASSIQVVNHKPRGLSEAASGWRPYELPAGSKRTPQGFEWTFKTLKPTKNDNLEIVYRSEAGKRLGEGALDRPGLIRSLESAVGADPSRIPTAP